MYNMQLHAFTSNDLPLLSLLQPEGWHDIIPVFTFYETSPFCFPIKITIANELVGVGTTIIHNDVAWLAHIIVHADYRNRGIGKLITQSLIDSIDHRICKTIYLIATDLGTPVYQKLGFETETQYIFYKDLPIKSNCISSPNIVSYTKTHYEQIRLLDQKISSEDRMFHLEKYIRDACVYVSNNRVEGYYLPGFNDGLIIAANSMAGIELMNVRLTTNTTAAFPIENTDAITFMSEQGHVPFKSADRMRLGEIRNVDFSKIYNRIAGSIG